MRPRSLRSFTFLSAFLGVLAWVLPGVAAEKAGLRAILEVDREAYYAGDPVPVRLSIWNDGDAQVDAPGGDLTSGFELHDAGGARIGPAAPPAGAAPASTRPLTAGSFFGYANDLTRLFPKLKEPGTFRLNWTTGGLASNAVILKVVPRYDPDKEYTARVETDMGAFTLEFFRKEAPITVKTFIELAQEGFYEGAPFHWIESDRLVVTGDPTGTGQGGPGFTIPPESGSVEMLAGTVIMSPTGRPPANGSIFAVLLSPRADYKGRMTGFAQVVEGLEVVKQISRVPASPATGKPPHKPLKDVRIKRITVRVKDA